MARAARLGLPVAVHAESEELTRRPRAPRGGRGPGGRARLPGLAAGRRRARGDRRARSRFAAETGCALHVVHVSSGRGVALVAEARARGVDVTLRDVPALPRARRGRRRAPRRRGQVRAAAARRGRARGAVGGAARRRRRPGRHRPLAVARGAQGGRRLLRGLGRDRRRPDAAGAALRRGRRGARPGARGARPSCSPRRRRGASAWRRARARSRSGADADVALVDPAATWTIDARRPARPPPAQPVRGARAARPRRAHDPARAHDRPRRPRSSASPAGAWCAAAPRLARRERPGRRHRRAGAVQRRPRGRRDHPRGLHADLRHRARVGRRAHARRGPRDAPGRRGQPLRPLDRRRARRAGRASPARTSTRRSTPGAYDGVLGVLGAIEAVRALRAAGVAPAALDRASSRGPARSRASAPAASAAARPPASCERADLDRLVDRDGTSMARRAARARASTPTGWPTRASIPAPCTRSSSCTSSRASSSRPTASRSASSPRSPRPTTSA